MIVKKIKTPLKGTITIPADKSITHRAIMFSSIASGKNIVENISLGQDCISTLNIFKNLGVDINFISEKKITINAKNNLIKPKIDLDCGNSGTSMRLITGILAGQNFSSSLIGDASLSKRPMKRIITPLQKMGAIIEAKNESFAPLNIIGTELQGIDYKSELASAQVKSCILLAGLFAKGKTSFTEPFVSRNHTEKLLKYLNADININNKTVSIKESKLASKDIYVAGDISSAAFFIVAGLIIPNSDIIIKNVGLNPTRTGIIDIVEKMGGQIEILNKRIISNEEIGDIRVKYSDLKSCTIEGEIIPRLIDELPIIAVLATQAKGSTIIKNAEDLRNKESDRIKSVVNELKKIGANIEETTDGFIIEGKTKLKGNTEVESYHDHRLAMSWYISGLICENPIKINEFDWIKISFPEFETLINELQK